MSLITMGAKKTSERLRGSSVNEFSFGDRKSLPQNGTRPLDAAEIVLKSADIRTYRVRANRDGEVVDI